MSDIYVKCDGLEIFPFDNGVLLNFLCTNTHTHTHTYYTSAVPNRVYVQLPNTTDVLEARIREGVNTTLDCGLYIDLVTSFPFTRNHYTYWTLHVRRFNGSLVGGPGANVTAGE